MNTSMRAVSAKYVFNGVNLLSNKAVLLADNEVVAIVDRVKVHGLNKIQDYGNCVISPGLIDLQLNGCGGVMFNAEISLATLEQMHLTNLRFGTTGFLPTLITCEFNDVLSALEVVKQWFKLYANKRGVIGLHIEGPFISRIKRGIHPEEYVILPTDELLAKIVIYTKYFPIKLTIAPENFTAQQIEFLVKHGVIVAIGHSNADFTQAQMAFDHGASASTHIFNAMSGLSARVPGVIAAILANPCYQGLIVDLLHVDMANVKLVTKLKPTTTYLVTDAVLPTGTNITEFDFANKHLYVKDGRCVDSEGTLGGAYLTMNEALYNCVNKCGIPLEQALMMATLIPAQVMGLADTMGKIAAGYNASLIALDLVDYSCQVI